MSAKTCPRCRTINEPDVETCDCGYEFATGILRVQKAATALSRPERERVAGTADDYRSLVVLVVLQALAGVASRAAAYAARTEWGDVGRGAVSLLSLVVLLALAVLAAAKTHRVVQAMEIGSPSAWAATVFLLGIFALLALNTRARHWGESYGLSFGILGPRKEEVDRLARGAA